MEPNISKHISFAEATVSQTSVRLQINNIPDTNTLAKMRVVANQCFEPIREHFNRPITISSFYRSKALNQAIGGVVNSQHQKGEAIDIQCGGAHSDMNLEILNWAKANLDVDQILNEYPDSKGRPAWIHISYVSKEANRHQFLTIK